jgi:hypothetical protein
MPDRLIHLLIRLYPRSWRDQYGADLAEVAREAHARRYQSLIAIAGDLLLGAFVHQVRRVRARVAMILVAMACAVGMATISVPKGTWLDGSGPFAGVSAHHVRAGRRHALSPKAGRRPTPNEPAVIRLNPVTGRVMSVRGQVRIAIQPETGRVLSAVARGQSRGSPS